jgi:hypothetical protein
MPDVAQFLRPIIVLPGLLSNKEQRTGPDEAGTMYIATQITCWNRI